MHRVVMTSEPLIFEHLATTMPVPHSCGALLWFFGVVRHENNGASVDGMTYECYESMARAEFLRIFEEVQEKWGVQDVLVAHRVGYLAVGETSLLLGTASPHRHEAYAAQQYIIDALKQRVPIWKKEHYGSGANNWLTT